MGSWPGAGVTRAGTAAAAAATQTAATTESMEAIFLSQIRVRTGRFYAHLHELRIEGNLNHAAPV